MTQLNSGGRPPKFHEPSKAITLTLPVSTLEDLCLIDRDRSRAIVKLTREAMHRHSPERALVEIVELAAGTGLVVVGPSVALSGLSFLHLVEVAPARFLLGIEAGDDFRSLELALQDLLEDLDTDERELALLTQLLETVKTLRRKELTISAELMLVRLGPKKRRP